MIADEEDKEKDLTDLKRRMASDPDAFLTEDEKMAREVKKSMGLFGYYFSFWKREEHKKKIIKRREFEAEMERMIAQVCTCHLNILWTTLSYY